MFLTITTPIIAIGEVKSWGILELRELIKQSMTEINPTKLATRRRELAMEYNNNCKRLAEIKMKKAFKIIEIRATVKSDIQAEREFQTTDLGQEELKLTYENKGLLELMRAVKTEVDLLNAESYGQY